MKHLILSFIFFCLCFTSFSTAKQSALLGKRYFSFSYGLGSHESVEDSLYITRLTMNIPVSRHLDLGFGSFQSWSEKIVNETSSTFREYTFFTNLNYHFLPNSVINPFLMIEMGQEASILESSNDSSDLTASSLMLGGDQTYSNSYNDFNFYYCGGIGEEFLINNKSSFSLLYKYGLINSETFQFVTGSFGYWILEQFYIDLKTQFHFNSDITSYHLVGNISF